MITVEEHETIRRAYYLEKKSKRQIAREQGHSRKTVDKAIENRPAQPYRLTKAKPAPVFGAYRERTDELLAGNAQLPRKQQYTAHKIYERLREEGYQGSEARVRLHVSQWNKAHKAPALFLPLEFEPGQDAKARLGRGDRDHRRSEANGASVCHVVVLQQAALCDGFSHAEARGVLLWACVRF